MEVQLLKENYFLPVLLASLDNIDNHLSSNKVLIQGSVIFVTTNHNYPYYM